MICIAGKNEIAVKGLKYLLSMVDIQDLRVVYNKTDDGENAWQPSLKFWSQQWGVQSCYLEDLYEETDLIFLSLEFDQIIKPQYFKSKQLYNIHFSLLPEYKGMYTSILPIVNGATYSGVSLHKIDRGIDTGDLIAQKKFEITAQENGRDLYQKYLDYGFELFQEQLPNLLAGTVASNPQSAVGASYYSTRALDFKNITIDYNKTAYEVHNQLRAFCFRDYQLPVFEGTPIYKTEITTTKSPKRPRKIIDETKAYYELSTIDYNIRLFKDYYEDFEKSCTNGDLEQAKALLPYIPDINLRNKKGWNAIIVACFNGQQDIINWLLEEGANINSTNYKGTSCLMYAKSAAERDQDTSILTHLLEMGADIHHKDEKGKTILEYAQENNSPLIIDFLTKQSAVY